MRTLILLVLLGSMVGCRSTKSVGAPRPVDRADDPMLMPYEQMRKTRYLHSFPDDELGPRSGPEKPPLGPPGI